MGTPGFAVSILENLVHHHNVVAVYTRPDAVRGRGKCKEASPVKEFALRAGIPVFEAKSLRDKETIETIASFRPEVICVAAYGAILPQEVLDIPPHGCLNVHASLLPAWRGSSPIERAILSGDKQAGVCIMRMDAGLDTGDFCVCRTTDIDDKGLEELTDELADLGSQALLTVLAHIKGDVIEWEEQNDADATYASKVAKHELHIALGDTSSQAARKVQASSPAHPSRCVLAGRTVTLLELRDAVQGEDGFPVAPGKVRFVDKRLLLGMGQGVCEVVSLKPDGKRPMDARSFAAGLRFDDDGMLCWEELDV